MNWFPMEMANRDGWPFIWLRRITVVGGPNSPRHEFQLIPLVRHGSSPDSEGYWRKASVSVPDSTVDMSCGWWCYELPVNADGTIKLPEDFHTKPLPGIKRDS